jgi:2,5-diketo-D-gluconate reductase A
VAQVVLRWLIQREIVAIPKSVNPGRMRENLDVFNFSLADDEMRQIAALETGTSLVFDHRDHTNVSWVGIRRLD